MKTIVEPKDVRQGLEQLHEILDTTLTVEPRPIRWSYPGDSEDDHLRTWSGSVNGLPFTIAIGPEDKWVTRTPVLLAREAPHPGMTPWAEMNLPVRDGTVHRGVNGCLCEDYRGSLFLMHRGRRFVVSPYVVNKASIHTYFAERLRSVHDDGQRTRMIPVGPIRRDFIAHAAAFADQVRLLKDTWAACEGDVARADARLAALKVSATTRSALAHQAEVLKGEGKPRHNILYLRAERSRPCWSNVTH